MESIVLAQKEKDKVAVETKATKEAEEAERIAEEKESHKLRQENIALRKDLVDLVMKHNNVLDAISKLGLNLQIVCNQNKFK